MPYIKRDANQKICAVSVSPEEGFDTLLDDQDPELQQFLASISAENELARSDLEFVRVLEDLVDVLMAKNVLLFTELPQQAQAKILERQALRRGDDALDLLGTDLDI